MGKRPEVDKAALGDIWKVQKEPGHGVLAFDCAALAQRRLANSLAEASEWMRVTVSAQSTAASDGSFDLEASVDSEANQDVVVMNVLYGDRDPRPRDIWARGTLDEFGNYSLGCLPDVETLTDGNWNHGRVVVVAANA